MPTHKALPKVVEKSKEELDEIFSVIQGSALPDDIKEFVIECIELAIWIPSVLQIKNISLKRLRTLLFGKGQRKKKNIPPKDDAPETNNNNSNTDNVEEPSLAPSSDNTDNTTALSDATDGSKQLATLPTNDKKKKSGHGRMPHTVYEVFTEIVLPTTLSPGDPCPLECGGRLYGFKPGILVRIRGQSVADVYKYKVEKLRCPLCNLIVSAYIPPEVGREKYDAAFKAWLVLQKYYVAIPFFRQESFQRLVGFPLPDATQWDLIEQAAGCVYPVFNLLKILAAQGDRVFNDDTRLRILEVIEAIKNDPDRERTGMYTTGIIAEFEGHQIALFLNGTQHAGENLRDILENRSPDLGPIIQMCDALDANIPEAIQTIICNCLSHGFRKFEELLDYFPEECITIMRMLSLVYKNDEKTKGMTDDERLAYHQEHSGPIMEQLKIYIATLLDEHLVEPNSELGKALRYLQKHWDKLTRFLTVAGAPLDNNVVERALKVPIRNRKSAMFYKTCYSASIGGMLTSLIYTCHLAEQNALDYLTVLQQHKQLVMKEPDQWLPWNYKQTLQSLENNHDSTEGAANQSGHSPPGDHLVAA